MRIILGLSMAILLTACCANCEIDEQNPKLVTETRNAVLWAVDAPAGFVGATWAGLGTDVTSANTPTPGNGSPIAYWQHRNRAMRAPLLHSANTMKYLLLNTNSSFTPYDTWSTQFSRSRTNIHNTFDTFLFNFDWDNPYSR